MISDLFSGYCEYKIKTIYQYSLVLSKIIGVKHNKLFNTIRNKEDFWKYVSNDYTMRYVNNVSINKYLVKGFFNNKDIINYKLTDELMSIINYFINKNMIMKIDDYKESIILAAYILKISNELDKTVSPYIKNNNNYNTIIINLLNQANKIPFIYLLDNGKKEVEKLNNLVKENVKKERKIFETLTNLNSFNKYIDISQENIYYLSQYNYKIANLNKYDEYAIKDVYDKLGVDNQFVLISANLISITMMKLFSVRKRIKTFFLPIRVNFFENEHNIKELGILFKNKTLSKYFKILINYNEYNDDIAKLLKKYNIPFYIFCSKNCEAKNGKRFVNCDKYLVSKDFNNTYKDVITKWKQEGINIIIEAFDGIVTDQKLLEE